MPHSPTRITKSVAKILHVGGRTNNSIFWRKKYYGLAFFNLLSFFAHILYFYIYFFGQFIYLFVCALCSIVKDLKTIKDLFFLFVPCYCCCFQCSMRYVSFIIIMYGIYLFLLRWESHFLLLSLLPIVACCMLPIFAV